MIRVEGIHLQRGDHNTDAVLHSLFVVSTGGNKQQLQASNNERSWFFVAKVADRNGKLFKTVWGIGNILQSRSDYINMRIGFTRGNYPMNKPSGSGIMV